MRWVTRWVRPWSESFTMFLCEILNLTSMLHQSVLAVLVSIPGIGRVSLLLVLFQILPCLPTFSTFPMGPMNRSKCLALEGGSASGYNQSGLERGQ